MIETQFVRGYTVDDRERNVIGVYDTYARAIQDTRVGFKVRFLLGIGDINESRCDGCGELLFPITTADELRCVRCG